MIPMTVIGYLLIQNPDKPTDNESTKNFILTFREVFVSC